MHDPERIGEQSLGEGIQSAQNQITAFHVPAQALPKALELGASLGIEKVIQATDRHTIETTQQRLMDGSFQFWSATENGRFIGCMITEVVRGATGDTLHIPYMAGERPTEWAPMMIEVMAPMVEEAGLEAVTTETREGMRKFLISLGWRKVSINMRLDLDNGRQK